MLGIRLEPDPERMLRALARARRSSKSALAREAIRRYVAQESIAERARDQSQRASGTKKSGELRSDDDGWTR